MPTYLIIPNTDREDKILQRFAAARDIKLQWITVDPNPNYDGETTVVDEAAWNGVSSSVEGQGQEGTRPRSGNPGNPLRHRLNRTPTPTQQARWEAVQQARQKGLSLRDTARELGMARDTVGKYAKAKNPPTKLLSAKERAKAEALAESETAAD